ncbi:sensor histidine kinase [Corynebacterium aquilae]|uniref:sensor histidine kinase n=1 Tax=Corynebacterium aquilae TaxID=203263 RepID=UPI0009514018|nr:sensor histidine kinase [Corynebacterium aquilae]
MDTSATFPATPPRAAEEGQQESVSLRARRRPAPSENAIRQGIHILTTILLLVVIAASLRGDVIGMLVTTGLCGLYAGIYVLGDRAKHPVGSFAAQGWLVALTAVWVAMLPISPTAIYMLFPLFFLYLHVLPDYRGIVAIVVTTTIGIGSLYPNITAGGVLGPTVAALVTIGIDYAFKALIAVNNERQALIEELLATRHQLAKSERAAGVAAERQRIAHEIHDTLAQGLSSIQMLLRVTEQDIAALPVDDEQLEGILKRLELARTTAGDNLQEARAMIAALQPAALSKTSLEGALQRVAGQIVGPKVHIHVEGEERQLPMRTEAALLRIAQGAMGNVAKHAHAEACHVTLTYGEDEVRIDVVDNGVGFDPATVAARPAGLGHIGLDAMKQRAAEQHGEVTVESTPGRGTAVSIAIPIEEQSPTGTIASLKTLEQLAHRTELDL